MHSSASLYIPADALLSADPVDVRAQCDLICAVLLVIAEEPSPAHRAEALARTITDPDRQAVALVGLVAAVAQAGDLDRAEALARGIPGPGRQAEALASLATIAAQAGDRDRAAHLLTTVLVMDMPGISWMKTMSQFFQSAIGDTWDILSGIYAPPA